MKDDLPHFSHDNDSRNHAKMKALRARYGWTGYGQFWALNEMIAGSERAMLDISRNVIKSAVACEIGMTPPALDDFLAFLSDDSECGLICYEDGLITTDRTQEDYRKVDDMRVKWRLKKEKKQDSPEKTDFSPGESEDFQGDSPGKPPQSKEEYNKETGESATPPEESLFIADKLELLHRERIDPGFSTTPANRKKWATDIDKLNRIDGRSWQDINKALEWVKTPGNFWAPNIMSGKKLRSQFPTVWAQMPRGQSKTMSGIVQIKTEYCGNPKCGHVRENNLPLCNYCLGTDSNGWWSFTENRFIDKDE